MICATLSVSADGFQVVLAHHVSFQLLLDKLTTHSSAGSNCMTNGIHLRNVASVQTACLSVSLAKSSIARLAQ